MKKDSTRTRRDMWDQNDFEDLNSHSSGEPPQFDWMVNRKRAQEREQAERQPRPRPSERPQNGRERTTERRSRGGNPEPEPTRKRREPGKERGREKSSPDRNVKPRGQPPRQTSRERREPIPRKRRKPMSRFKRRTLMVLALVVMVLVTLFLAESLLLKVTAVQVTGDAPYTEEEIKDVCGYKTGDNLLFIPTKDREEKLLAQLPYIGKAKISRKLPGTVVINITTAQTVCAVETGGVWLLVSGEGKILEAVPAPGEGVMQVQGILPKNSQPGQPLEIEGAEAAKVFTTIMEKLVELDAEGFTRLDLSDLNNIRLWYQDRVECQLGNSAQLDYKLQSAHDLLTEKIGLDQRGVLKLGYLPEEHKSYFEAEDGSVPIPAPSASPNPASASPSPTPEPEGDGDWDPEPDYDGGSDEYGGDGYDDNDDEYYGGDTDGGDWDGEDWSGEDEDWTDPDEEGDGWEE